MHWSSTAAAVALTLSLTPGVLVQEARAACADLKPLRPILAPDLDAQTCENGIARAGRLYAARMLSAIQDCYRRIQQGGLVGDPNTVCRGTVSGNTYTPPTDARTAGRIAAAETRLRQIINRNCTDSSIAALRLCGNTVTAAEDCLLINHAQRVQNLLGDEYGTVAPVADVGARGCQAGLARASRQYLGAELRAIQVCLRRRNRNCTVGDPAILCIGSVAGGTAIPPIDATTAARLANAEARLRDRVTDACSNGELAALDACANTVTAVGDCLTCSHRSGGAEMIGAQFGGAEGYADPSTTIQGAVDAASPGDTIYLYPGTYAESVDIETSGLSIIGNSCNGQRPALINPNPGSTADGIRACGSLDPTCSTPADDLLFESFDVGDFDDNGILVVGAEGVTFRDIVATAGGTNQSMEYAVFPVFSNDVLIEDCVASGVSDAALYVGQSTNIVVRNNEVFGNVAGIEIENSANAEVYGNFAHDNTGGILVFKLPGLPTQLSQCHDVHDNISQNNNGPNYGSGTVGLVPQGSGIVILSNDASTFRNNTVTGNGSFGIALTDQVILNVLFDPNPFPILSPDPTAANNFITNNILTGNGLAPDPAVAGFEADLLSVTGGGTGNCRQDNTVGTTFELPALATSCPSPPPPGCPFSTSTTVTTTTNTTMTTVSSTTTVSTSSTTSTTSVTPFTWTQVYGVMQGNCSFGCHENGLGGFTIPPNDSATAYNNTVGVASNRLPTMNRVEPFYPLDSFLMHKLDNTQGTFDASCTGGSCGSSMPLSQPLLPLTTRDGIRAWISFGAPQN
jgi:parallel beta-helix repeat protein